MNAIGAALSLSTLILVSISAGCAREPEIEIVEGLDVCRECNMIIDQVNQAAGFVSGGDFVGWYCDVSSRRCGISKRDAYDLYLAHHEGHGGYNNRTYRNKKWLLEAAAKVRDRAKTYRLQLSRCREKLDRPKKKKFWFF